MIGMKGEQARVAVFRMYIPTKKEPGKMYPLRLFFDQQ